MKHFSVAEAEALLPEIDAFLDKALDARDRAARKADIVAELEGSGVSRAADAVIERTRLRSLIDEVNAWLAKIAETGAIPKGLDPALVDFPCKLEGRTVLLCWARGEDRISHYHGDMDGFSGRKPLPKDSAPDEGLSDPRGK